MGGQSHARPLFPRERDPVPIVQEAGWASGLVWTCAENVAPTGMRPSDRPARSESLYQLGYPGPHERSWFMLNVGSFLPAHKTSSRFITPRHNNYRRILSLFRLCCAWSRFEKTLYQYVSYSGMFRCVVG